MVYLLKFVLMDIQFSCVRARVCFYGHLRVYVRVDHNLFDLRYFPPSICAIKMVDFVSRFWVSVSVWVGVSVDPVTQFTVVTCILWPVFPRHYDNFKK